jgi:hypothetical protein
MFNQIRVRQYYSYSVLNVVVNFFKPGGTEMQC